MLSPLDLAPDQTGVFEEADVLADRRLREAESPGCLPDGCRSLGKPFDDRPPGGMREGEKAAIELR